ncbi:hypothetical protein MRX96_017402 [Rhipicephalus microplus]
MRMEPVAEANCRIRSRATWVGAQREWHALNAEEASCRRVLPFMFQVPHEPGAQRVRHLLDAAEASCRSKLPFTFWCHMNLVLIDLVLREHGTCSMLVKPVAEAYCRLRSACDIEPVLRESVARSMRVKTVAEAYCRLRSGCDMDLMLTEEHALDTAEGSCSSALPFTFRVPQGPGAQREWRALDAG